MKYEDERNILQITIGVLIILLASIIFSFVFFILPISQALQPTIKSSTEFDLLEVSDIMYVPPVWEYDPEQDLQTPELPTGCEATAASTLLRMNGVMCTKFDVANAMPKSDSEFVSHFWGNPYSEHGWSCMAPCIAITMSEFITDKQTIRMLDNVELKDLPTPCQIWVTMYMEDIWWSSYQSEGYHLAYNPHSIVITDIDIQNDTIYVVDPLVGQTTYSLDRVSNIYDGLGRQAIYIETISN